MDTDLISSETIELLSRLTGQKLTPQELTPPVIFLANLVTVLLGVIFADTEVTTEEKQRFQTTLNQFIPPANNIRQLAQSMIRGIRDNPGLRKPSALLQLAAPLSKSEKLLLLGLGYEMSAADGTVEPREARYLEIVAECLGLDPRHLEVFHQVFSHQNLTNKTALEEVKFLLDAARFQNLDPIFVKAASDLLEVMFPATKLPLDSVTSDSPSSTPATLLNQPPHHLFQSIPPSSYKQLAEFQTAKKNLAQLCEQLFQIIQDCTERDLLPRLFIKQITKISGNLQSQRFRVAVIGEFSQGKSTLLNALLGDNIQPVRAIPCSGTITVLKYGVQMRVICRYKDGSEAEIPIEEYKVKASLPKDFIRNQLSIELASSQIDEIIFEHPALDLCRNGVEIIDSPGLNEHPDRAAVTQKLLQDTDVAIFLTNAMRLLTENEKELIHYVRSQLNVSQEKRPVENLFIVVNFMDLLEDEAARQEIRQRLENFVREQTLLTGENRLHYISAKAALKAILKRESDQFLQKFQTFTQALERFLTRERGSLKIQQSVHTIEPLIQEVFAALSQAETALDGKLNLSETEQKIILEQLSEMSGRDIRIKQLTNQLLNEVSAQVEGSWNDWLENLQDRLLKKAEKWTSEHSVLWNRDLLAKDYARQFNQDLSEELEQWIHFQLKDVVLKQPLEVLKTTIEQELNIILTELKSFNQSIKAHIPTWIYLNEEIKPEATADEGFFGSLGMTGLAVALVPVIVVAGPILTVIASLGAVVAGRAGVSMVFGGVTGMIKN